jgi:hypothetical protein
MQGLSGLILFLQRSPSRFVALSALVAVVVAVWRWGQYPAVLAFGHLVSPLARMASAIALKPK